VGDGRVDADLRAERAGYHVRRRPDVDDTHPADYAGPAGEVRVKVRGTRSSSFRTQTDLLGVTVEY
jgi:hypothetical protein